MNKLILTRKGNRKKPWGWLLEVDGKVEIGSADFFPSRKAAIEHFERAKSFTWFRYEIEEQR